MAEGKNGRTQHGSIEIYFAKKLANNDKKIRDRAVKRMKIWLSSKTGDSFSDLDMLKLWKGLFYCMWFSDKPLVQEDLADSIAKLIHHLKDRAAVTKFINAFFQIMGREWHGVDRLRLDKFYMLIRRVLREVFAYVQDENWNEETINGISETLINGPCSVKNGAFPDGIKMFTAEIFVDELRKQIKEPLEIKDAISKLIDPFIKLFAQTENGLVSNAVNESIFQPFLSKNEDKDTMTVEVDLKRFGARIFEEAINVAVKAKKRKKMLQLSKQFNEAADSKMHKEDEIKEDEVKEDEVKEDEVKEDEVKEYEVKEDEIKEDEVKEDEVKEDEVKEDDENDKEKRKGKRKARKRKSEKVAKTGEKKKKKQENEASKEGMLDEKITDSLINEGSAENDVQAVKPGEAKNVAGRDKDLDQNTVMMDQETASVNEEFESKKKKKVKRKGKINKDHKIEHGIKQNETEDKQNSVESEMSLEANVEEKNKNESKLEEKIKPKKRSKTLEVERTKRRTRQSKLPSEDLQSGSPSAKKKVVFELTKNAVTSISNLKINPATVFTPEQKPKKGVLKTQTPRRRASDFF